MLKQKFIKYIPKILGITCIYLIILELLARIIFGIPKDKIKIIIPDLTLNHKWQPYLKYEDTARAIPYMLYTNSQSWVEQYNIKPEKPKNTYRIFYVGDSNTQGVVAPEKKMAKIVEKELNDVYKKYSTKIEVINTGTSSYSPSQYYLIIKNNIIPYSPDLVVIDVDMTDVPNDAYYKTMTIYDTNGLPLAIKPVETTSQKLYRLTPYGTIKISPIEYWRSKTHDFLTSESVLYYIFENKLLSIFKTNYLKNNYEQTNPWFQLGDQSANWLSKNWTEEIKSNVQYTMFLLSETIKLLQSKNIKVMLTGVPHFPQYTDEWSSKPHEILENTAKANNCPFLNSYELLKPYMKNANVEKYYWNTDPTHFNEEGNVLWAKIQLEFLLDENNGLLPQRK